MPNVLIVYGTTEGQTRRVATSMAQTLRTLGNHVDIVEATAPHHDPNPEHYNAVIVAASVHAGKYQRDVCRWVKAHASTLQTRHTAFVSVCLAILQRSPSVEATLNQILESFYAATGWRPTETKIVAGALLYTKYNWLKRLIMRRIVAKAHGDTDTSRDYDYTDWDDVDAFARGFAERAGTVLGCEGAKVPGCEGASGDDAPQPADVFLASSRR